MVIIDVHKHSDGLNGIYKQIVQLLTIDQCLILYQNFKGLTITFPTKLIHPDYVKEHLRLELSSGKQMSKKEIQQCAIYFDYSERQIRRFIREVREEDT